MALSCSLAFTIASSKPVPRNGNSERVKPILKEFKPDLSISQNHTLASGPLRHPQAIDTDKEGRFEQYLRSDIMSLMSLCEASQPRDEETEFKMVQSHRQHEIVEISWWWKDLGLSKELKFARDQPLKWYIWSISGITDPSLSEERIELTKPISMIYIIDDIFDVHGTLDELVCFTEVINRWDLAATEQLPDYMKTSFKALDNITNEISHKIYKKHGWNPVDSLRKTWASLCNAFLVEAKWFASGKLPSAEEYLKNGIVSSGVHVILVHIFFLLGEGTSKETVEFIESYPSIISSTATILRLWDDMGSAKDENQDGHDGSYVECYLKENEGSSFEDARNEVLHIISEAWKQLNEECISPYPFSETFSKASLNIARMVPLMYNYDDNNRLPGLDEHVNLSSKKMSL